MFALAGCGNAAPDLFVVTRSGTIPGAHFTLRLRDDGIAYCNGASRMMTSDQLLEARALARDLGDAFKGSRTLPPGPNTVLSYRVLLPDTTLRFSDSSRRQPGVLRRVAALTRDVAIRTCGLKR